MSEANVEKDESDFDAVVMLRCACGCGFERDKKYLEKYDEFKTEYPSAARFFKRKIDFCDNCLHEKIKKSLKALPEMLKVLAT